MTWIFSRGSQGLSATVSVWAQLKTCAHVWNQCDEIQVDVHRKCVCSHLIETKLKMKTTFFWWRIRYEVQLQVNKIWVLLHTGVEPVITGSCSYLLYTIMIKLSYLFLKTLNSFFLVHLCTFRPSNLFRGTVLKSEDSGMMSFSNCYRSSMWTMS